MTASEPDRDLAALAALSAWIDRVIAEHEDALALRVPEVSGWSVEHQLAHASLANELCLKNVASLVKGSGMLVVRGGEPVEGARAMLRSAAIPRGRAQSPRMVRPPEAVDRALLREWQASNRREIERWITAPGSVVSSELRIPHQLLGPLDAPDWVRFAAVHTRHHLAIAAEIAGAAGARRALPEVPRLSPRPGS